MLVNDVTKSVMANVWVTDSASSSMSMVRILATSYKVTHKGGWPDSFKSHEKYPSKSQESEVVGKTLSSCCDVG